MVYNDLLITVAIPTFKRPKFLKAAIDSAVNQLDSDIKYDIIVVNNDPESDMSSLEQFYKNSSVSVKFYNNERNLGMLGNINRCVELANGYYIAFLHDDDLLLPNYMYEMGNFIKSYRKDFSCIIPRRYLLFDDDSRGALEKKRLIKSLLLDLFPQRLLYKRIIYPIHVEDNIYSWIDCYGAPSCGSLFNKKSIKKTELFGPQNTYSWDFLSFLKLNEKNNIFIINRVISIYRMTSGASLRPDVQVDFFKTFEELKNLYMNKNDNCSRFIKKYYNEISYLNSKIMNQKAQALAKQNGISFSSTRPSMYKFLVFMYKRIKYFAVKRLDIEVPMTKKIRNKYGFLWK